MRLKFDRRLVQRCSVYAFMSGCLIAAAPVAVAQTQPGPAPAPSPTKVTPTTRMSEVVVTASRLDLLGKALTASQGSITKDEIELRPIYRIGQIYETVPGLVVTVHSGEGKANQYLLRGFNLDHGTDFASFVDDMPVNRPTNTHGQGYSDQNFLMPEIIQGLDFTKGPFYAAVGDFGAVGSAHVRLTDDLPNQMELSAGTLGDENLFAGGTYPIDQQDRVWAAFDVGHLDGPWDPPGNFNKYIFTGRFSHGSDADGYSLTAMYYNAAGHLETDQSIYAIQDGLIGRFGVLDPSDASRSERYSLSGHYGVHGDHWTLSANAYAIHSTMTLWNDFTHYLFDSVNGDQEQQDETRNTAGTDLAFTWAGQFGSIRSDTVVGLQDRYDSVYVDRRHTHDRVALDYCELANVAGTAATPYAAIDGACNADRVGLNDLGVYVQTTTHWTSWLRTVLGLREEGYQATDHSLTEDVRHAGSQTLFQPKGSLIFGPWVKTELYVSAGRGFHSNDVRGVFETVPLEGIQNLAVKTPLMSPATSEEVGLRTDVVPRVQIQASVFQEDFSSEVAYDQDQGEDQASAPSRRQGIELSAQYRPLRWMELNSDLAFSKARYNASLAELATYGLPGPYIDNAPSFIGSFGVLVHDLGPWFGGLQWRDLGPYPVNDGEEYPQDKGYSEVNLDAGYTVSAHLKLQASIYNLFNSHADAAAYYYTSRLVPDGPEVTGLQIHPLEPISGRFTATYTF
jgi:outer membrane receptor protein involved in Fe transport